jgi:hypothetical protein
VRRSVSVVVLLALAWIGVAGSVPDDCDEQDWDCCGPVCFSCLCCPGCSTAAVAPGSLSAALVLSARLTPEPRLPRLEVLPRPILHVPRPVLAV